jgi:hypothetical protein
MLDGVVFVGAEFLGPGVIAVPEERSCSHRSDRARRYRNSGGDIEEFTRDAMTLNGTFVSCLCRPRTDPQVTFLKADSRACRPKPRGRGLRREFAPWLPPLAHGI